MTGSSSGARRYCIIHGHFYQPPRENPWIDIIETQESAAPAHDWNERVCDECYRPNAFSRILDPDGMIASIYNNYSRLSFNFGPTLFLWLEKKHPALAARIIDADKDSCARLDNHGNSIAQVYNHIILPLASRRDKVTQIRWAKSFFRSRFGREPEGMWLSETAINAETAECLIDEGFTFVILAPTQAESFRKLSADTKFTPAEGGSFDTRRPYRLYTRGRTGSGEAKHIDVFFFNEGLSKEASFGGLLNDANGLAKELSHCFDPAAKEPQVAVLATDGETFGHHKAFGDMCLAYFFAHAARAHGLVPVNFGYYLANNAVNYEVRLKNASGEGTAWSCAHGTGRWIRDCGCQTGGPASFNQAWRSPLRTAFENLQKRLDKACEEFFGRYGMDAWQVRDNYEPVMGRGMEMFRQYLSRYTDISRMPGRDIYQARRLLDAQKYALFMYTSCGWFFADISGIEATQNLRYACRALQLGLVGDAYAEALQELEATLEKAKSNIGGQTGKTLFGRYALPFSRHLELLCFAAAVESVVSSKDEAARKLFGFRIRLHRIEGASKSKTDMFWATIGDGDWGFDRSFSIQIRSSSKANISGDLIPCDIPEDCNSSPSPQSILVNSKDAMRLGLGDIFTECKQSISLHFLSRLSENTRLRYLSWMKTNERVLGALAGLNGTIPAFLQGPVSYLLTSEWDSVIVRLHKAGTEDDVMPQMLELSHKAEAYGIHIDFSQSVALLERLLAEGIEELSRKLSVSSCDRLRYLLNIVDRFAVPVAKYKIEDAFYPLLNGSIKALYESYHSDSALSREKKRYLASLLGFARRMNFSTAGFSLE